MKSSELAKPGSPSSGDVTSPKSKSLDSVELIKTVEAKIFEKGGKIN